MKVAVFDVNEHVVDYFLSSDNSKVKILVTLLVWES